MDSPPSVIDKILCGAIEGVKTNRSGREISALSLLILSKEYPSLFAREECLKCLVACLKHDNLCDHSRFRSIEYSSKFSTSVISRVLRQQVEWPTMLVHAYLEDSLSDRNWVDDPDCQVFVANIMTAFNTKVNSSLLGYELKENERNEVKPRFDSKASEIHQFTLEMLKERCERRQNEASIISTGSMPSHYHNLVKTFVFCCGVSSIRVLACSKLDSWMQHKFTKTAAQDLLMAICLNCNTHSQEDIQNISQLTKLRSRPKCLQYFFDCLKELIKSHPSNHYTLITHLIYMELSNNRLSNNMVVLVGLLPIYPSQSTRYVAQVCQGLVLNKDDSIRPVRTFVREVFRCGKSDFDLLDFIVGFLIPPDPEKLASMTDKSKERFVSLSCDLVCMVMLSSVTSQVKEALHIMTGKKPATVNFDPEVVVDGFRRSLAQMQQHVIWWMQEVVLRHLHTKRLAEVDFIPLLNKVLFLKLHDSYHSKDNWPLEAERAFLFKACHDVYVTEDSIMRLAQVARSPDFPRVIEGIEIINQMIRRAASIPNCNHSNPISCNRTDLLVSLLDLAVYRIPDNITTPDGYQPPSRLLIGQYYWSLLQSLLIIAAFNPATVGRQAWLSTPTLKSLMEMSISNRFCFPPLTIASDQQRSELIAHEQHASANEKHTILELETILAAASTGLKVTESSSLLLPQIIIDHGQPLRPPDGFLDQFSRMSRHLDLGVRLCRSRDSDFLLEIMDRYGENQTIPWLSDLVASTRGDLSALNVQCLCEFFLAYDEELNKKANGAINKNDLTLQLRKILLSDRVEDAMQVLRYLIKRLSSKSNAVRARSLEGLSPLLYDIKLQNVEVNFEDARVNPHRWLLVDLPHLQFANNLLQTEVSEAIKAAIVMETDPWTVAAYVNFLRMQVDKMNGQIRHDVIFSIAETCATLVYQRPVLVSSILTRTQQTLVEDLPPSSGHSIASSFISSLLFIFQLHLQSIFTLDQSSADDNSPPDGVSPEIYVCWPDNARSAKLTQLMQRSIIILISYGPPSFYNRLTSADDVDDDFYKLFNLWVSPEGRFLPQGFAIGTREKLPLISDADRSRIVTQTQMTSSTKPIILAAVDELLPQNLIKFIQSFGVPDDTMTHLLKMFVEKLPKDEEARKVIYDDIIKNNISDYFDKFLEIQRLQKTRVCDEFVNFFKTYRPAVEVVEDMEVDIIKMDSNKPSKIKSSSSLESSKYQLPANNLLSLKSLINKSFSSDADLKEWRFYITSLTSIASCKSSGGKKNGYLLTNIKALQKLLQNADFFNNFMTSSQRACSFLRLINRCLTSGKVGCGAKTIFKNILAVLHEKCQQNNIVTSFSKLIAHWLKHENVITDPDKKSNLLTDGGLEKYIRESVDQVGAEGDKILSVANLLLEEIKKQQKLTEIKRNENSLKSVGNTGLLIDWLQLLDPELLAHMPTLQRKLLFEIPKSKDTKYNNNQGFDQSYLLSLLVECCDWSTIRSTIHWLLSDVPADPTETNSDQSAISIDPKTALDFLSVVVQAPKLWQGRENKSTSVSEAVMKLEYDQTCKLLNYIVAATVAQQQRPVSTCDTKNPTFYIDNLSTLFSKFGQDQCKLEEINKIILYTRHKLRSTSTTSTFSPVWFQTLALLYIMKPNATIWDRMQVSSLDRDCGDQFYFKDLIKFTKVISKVTAGSNCRTDALICSLLNRVGYMQASVNIHGKAGSGMQMADTDSATDASLLLLKIGSWRPFLLLRQMPLICAMIRGRTRFEFNEFKGQRHLPLMMNLLYLLLQLSSYIFCAEYESLVTDLISTLWQVLKNYCQIARRQLQPIMLQTVLLTHRYLYTLPRPANRLMCKHVLTFKDLINAYSDCQQVVCWMESIISFISSTVSDKVDEATWAARLPYLPPPPSRGMDEVVPAYMDLLCHSDNDVDILTQALTDLEKNAQRHEVNDLTTFLPVLNDKFVRIRDPNVRKVALSLLLRHARADPSSAKRFIFSAFLSFITGRSEVS